MSKIKLLFLSILAVFAVSAIASATASAGLEFYGCQSVTSGTGKWEDSRCSKPNVSGNFELFLIQSLLAIVSSGGPYKLKTKAFGTKITIECKKEKGTGSIHNGLIAGVLVGLGLVRNKFTECEVVKPAGCTVTEPIETNSLVEASEDLARPYVLFFPDPTGSAFATITLANCAGLNGNYTVAGSVHGLVNNETSTDEFSEGAPNNQLTFGGEPAIFEGKSVVEMEGGGPIHVK